MAALASTPIALSAAVALLASTAAPAIAREQSSSRAPIRTFELPKATPAPDSAALAGSRAVPERRPGGSESLRATLGLGYVQGADWGTEAGVVGSFAGLQVHLDSLVTRGSRGTRMDRGTLRISDPDRQWRLIAGDVFSPLRGATRGASFSWDGRGGRRPAVSILADRFGRDAGETIAAYRDGLFLGDQTLVDFEIATDRSWMTATRWQVHPVGLEASYRSRPGRRSRDYGLTAGVDVWRGVHLGGSSVWYDDAGQSSNWQRLSVRVPIGRWADITFERTFSRSGAQVSDGYAVMGGATAGRSRFFHRYQRGRTELSGGEFDAVISREQAQSMASYSAGPRLSLTMQLATAWTPAGRADHWQELLASVVPWQSARLQVVAAVPDVTDVDRLRLRVEQQLPSRFALLAEFGRVSAFQSLRPGQDLPRARVMLSRSWTVGTPARGAVVAGRVLDHAGHPVGGARVMLGPYAVSTDPDGAYLFSAVPRGRYDLALDAAWMPASYAWDGDRRSLDLTHSDRVHFDLGVTPLNAVHGRVVVDRNGDGLIAPDEGVQGAVVRLGDRVSATDETGAWAFYNLWPGDYVVTLDVEHLPAGLAAGPTRAFHVTLSDDGPATGVDMALTLASKPIVWRKGGGR